MGPLERLGSRTIAAALHVNDVTALLARVVAAAVRPTQWRRTARRVLLWQLYFSGVQATPFLLVLALLVGVLIVMQAQLWLKSVGQTALLAPLLVTVVIRELAPLLVNLILIGRSGNAMTVELGNMTVNGEIDALESQGVGVFGYLVVPRVLALAVSSLCLTVLFTVVAIAGGYVCGVLVGTNPGPPGLFHDDLMRALTVTDGVSVVVKSVVPAALTGCICCACGLGVTGGVSAVPPAAIVAMTRAVIATFTVSVLVSVIGYL